MRFTKGIIFAVLISSIVCSSVMAQVETGSKVYIKIYGGYGLLTPGSYRLESTSYNTTGSTTTGTATISKTGFGSGPKFGGGIGFIVSDFLNIGVDAEYFSGTQQWLHLLKYFTNPIYLYLYFDFTACHF